MKRVRREVAKDELGPEPWELEEAYEGDMLWKEDMPWENKICKDKPWLTEGERLDLEVQHDIKHIELGEINRKLEGEEKIQGGDAWFPENAEYCSEKRAAWDLVTITIRLCSEFGTKEDDVRIDRLEDKLRGIVEGNKLGEFDGHEFGGAQCTMFIYTRDKRKLLGVIEPIVRSALPQYAYKIQRD